MVGLVPTIHDLTSLVEDDVRDMDARHKGEHDVTVEQGSYPSPLPFSTVPISSSTPASSIVAGTA